MATRERSRRELSKNKKRKLQALSKIAKAREGGENIISDDDEDDNIYDVVTEEEYKKLVNERRKGEEFVVDDDGTGYYDDGEEHLFEVAEGEDDRYSKDASIKDPKARQRMRKQRKKASLNAAAAKDNHKLGAMFLGMSGTSKPEKKKQKTIVDDGDELDLDAELDSLNASDALITTAIPRRQNNMLQVSSAPQQQQFVVQNTVNYAPSRNNQQNLNDNTFDNDDHDNNNDMEVENDLVDIDEEADDHAASMVEANRPNTTTIDEVVVLKKDSTETTELKVAEKQSSASKIPKAKAVVEEDSDVKKLKDRRKALFLAQRQKAAAKSAAKTMEKLSREEIVDEEASSLDTTAKGGWFDVSSANGSNSAPSSQDSVSSYTFATAKDLPTMEGKDEDGDAFTFTRMYYLDAYADEYNAPGKIHLFGKVWSEEKKAYLSACIEVTGHQRQLFFLPKPVAGESEPDMGALYQEISELLSNKVIPRGTQGEKFKCKAVTRKYAFEYDGIPRNKEGTKYMKVLYNSKFPTLDLETVRGKHFSHIFGTKTKIIENFIVKRKLMGPCWIDIRDPLPGKNTSWAKLEGRVDDPKLISVTKEKIDPPPLNVMSISMKTYLNSKNHNHEIAMISAITHQDVLCHKPTPNEMDRRQISNFSLVRAIHSGLEGGVGTFPPGFPTFVAQNKGMNLKTLPNERAMLNIFMNKIQAADPDIIVGHAIKDHDLDVMMHRMAALKVNQWSKLGRLKLSKVPRAYQRGANSGMKNFQRVSPGRLIVDTYHCSKDVLQLKSSNFKLNTLAKKYLKIEKPPESIYAQDVPRYYSTKDNLMYLKKHTENFAYMALGLMFRTEMLPLSKQLTNLGGNLWIRTLTGGRAERIEYLLLHEFHNRKYIVPDKERPKKKAPGGRKRGKAKYAGGLVLEPKKGLYDKYVLLLDFNSLYPSIIQEFNLCYTTVTRELKPLHDDGDVLMKDGINDIVADASDEVKIPDLPDRTEHKDWGVLPTVIRTLIQRRSVVKKLLKKETDKEMKNTLNVRQLALKLTANSMYGCLGFSASRFYAAPIAALVTSQGREILQNTVDLASGMGLNVIYGDTDSIMIYTGSDDWERVQQLGKEVKKAVNKKYKLLEIEIDGVFKSMLLLKKKKYAALIASKNRKTGEIEYEKETKGLDLVRRDWCGLSKEVGLFVLDHVLSGEDREGVVASIHERLQDVAKKVREGSVPLEKYTITKGLNKNPKDYADRKGMPHLHVALEMVRRGRPVNVGDHIPYVITAEQEGVITGSFAERARHPDDLIEAMKAEEKTGVKSKLKIDAEWYLSQQILPPTSRLVDPIEGTSQAMIAEQLGLDSRKYGISSFSGDLGDEDMIGFTPSSQMSDEERFKNAKPLVVFCPKCEQSSSFSGVYRFPEVDSYEDAECGFKCPTPGCHNTFTGTKLQNILAIAMRGYCNEYYNGWSRCDDGTCQTKTRQQSCLGNACIAPGCNSTVHEIYPASELYTQLKYFESLFNMNAFDRKLTQFNAKRETHKRPKVLPNLTEVEKDSFRELRSTVQEYLGRSDYTWVKPTLWKNIFGSKRVSSFTA